jgi:LacI family transcriptional regulator
VEGVPTPSVVFSGHEIGFKAAEAMLARGHRRLAFVYPHRYSMIELREAGMRAAIAAHRGQTHLESISYDTINTSVPEVRQKIHDALQRILALPDRPTAIFCGSLTDAEHLYLQAQALGLDVPRDLSLIYFGSTWRPNALAERLSCIAVDERGMGAKAADMLHEMRVGRRPLDDTEQILFPTSFYEGETLAGVP